MVLISLSIRQRGPNWWPFALFSFPLILLHSFEWPPLLLLLFSNNFRWLKKTISMRERWYSINWVSKYCWLQYMFNVTFVD
ncbi:hypothetical protein I7I50_09215 [Histoplasma capsulatum G186AR]|uniref:Uncharacterized protein n=1 Tax=Ajellomyces capsulatus TaxID=5037 RepID=A0A8H7YV54_AJECA|nr:hypothetical protein I7I52_06736 [Histoplasma capsulatum]QSS74155.1 hypothetical protein I7I50_09215 [Histoplasma capsulatum G186AR]